MDSITAYARKLQPAEEPVLDATKALAMRIDPDTYVSLSSVAAKFGIPRGRLAGRLLRFALQELCDTLYAERLELSDGMSEGNATDQHSFKGHRWSFYSPSVAAALAETTQGTFAFVGVSDDEGEE